MKKICNKYIVSIIVILVIIIALVFIINIVDKNNKQIMPKVCPMDEHTKRETMKEQIFMWQKDIPMIRANLFGAISRNLDGWKNFKNDEVN